MKNKNQAEAQTRADGNALKNCAPKITPPRGVEINTPDLLNLQSSRNVLARKRIMSGRLGAHELWEYYVCSGEVVYSENGTHQFDVVYSLYCMPSFHELESLIDSSVVRFKVQSEIDPFTGSRFIVRPERVEAAALKIIESMRNARNRRARAAIGLIEAGEASVDDVAGLADADAEIDIVAVESRARLRDSAEAASA